MAKDQDIIEAVREQNLEVLHKILLKNKPGKSKLIGHGHKKININYQDNDGMSALHQAALQGNTDIVQMLLENGSSVDIRDNKGMRPLHYASWQGKPNPVDLLLQWHSSTNEPANNGETPLHLACQHGHIVVVEMLLARDADPTIVNADYKTALDLSCEFGRYDVAELLINSNLCSRILHENKNDMADNSRSTCLHLASKNGHLDIIRLLLQAGVDINRTTLQGTALHEAALCGKLEVVRLLIDCGIDVNLSNSYDQTALDIVNKFTTSRAAKELKKLLKEASTALTARALQDFGNPYEPNTFFFQQGEFIKVLEQCADGQWRGTVMHDSYQPSRSGYFPASAVVLVDKAPESRNHHVMNNNTFSQRRIPELVHNHQVDRSSYGSIGNDDSFPPPPSPLLSIKNPAHSSMIITASKQNCTVQRARSNPQFPMPGSFYANPQAHHSPVRTPGTPEHMLEPFRYSSDDPRSARDSPSNSSRNSAGSLDSGRSHGSTQYDNRLGPGVMGACLKSGHSGQFHVNVQVHSQHRLSGQSCESGVGLRRSYHSTSSSSLGSLDRLEESGYSSTVNVAELVQSGMNDADIIQHWLRELGFGDYYQNFAKAGYDMPTISRMTPEDLTAIGITKPRDRKRLKSEIAKLNIHDGIPEHKPKDVFEWLHLLNLEQYYDTLSRQGYGNIDYLTDITWEDLEEIGIKKLGHQKKIMLAIGGLKRAESGAKRLSQQSGGSTGSEPRASSDVLDPPTSTMSRWSADLTHTVAADPQYTSSMGYATLKPKKTRSELSAHDIYPSRTPGAEIIHMQQQNIPVVKYQPDLVAIQVNRNRSSSSDHGHVSYGSFQGPVDGDTTPTNERGSTPDDTDNIHLRRPSATVSPRVVAKPKPVAKIIAKTKRSSREFSTDVIAMEKSGGISQYATLRKPSLNSSQMYNYQNESDVMDTPPSPQKPYHGSPVIKPPIIPMSFNASLPPSCGSPRTKKPPPPPKRTNSIKGEMAPPHRPQFSVPLSTQDPKPQHPILSTRLSQTTNTSDQQQQLNTECVKSLSAKFNMDREKRPSPPKPEAYIPQDHEEFPPPPPPIATDLNAIKAHSQRTTASLNKVIEKLEEEQRKQTVEMHVRSDVPAYGEQTRPSEPVKHSENAKHSEEPQIRPSVVQKSQPEKEKLSKISLEGEEQQLHRGTSVKRNDSVNSFDSSCSTSSVDSNTLPFANENVGTIKQRNGGGKTSVVSVNFEGGTNGEEDDDDEDNEDFGETATMKRNPNRSQGHKPVAKATVNNNNQTGSGDYQYQTTQADVDNSGDILDDIGNMLQGLTDELDAMLDSDLVME